MSMNFLNKCFKSTTFNIFGALFLVLEVWLLLDIFKWRLDSENINIAFPFFPYFLVALKLIPLIIGIAVILFVLEKVFLWNIEPNRLTDNLFYRILLSLAWGIFFLCIITISILFLKP